MQRDAYLLVLLSAREVERPQNFHDTIYLRARRIRAIYRDTQASWATLHRSNQITDRQAR